MKTIEVVGFERKDVGTKFSKQLRAEGNVPCVLYGSDDHVHFHAPMYLFKELVYTSQAFLVKLNIEGTEYDAIMQDIQFHPVSEMILHVDFLRITKGTYVKMDVPVKTTGLAQGVKDGGVLYLKNRKLKVGALPKDLPDFIEIDVANVTLGGSMKIKEIEVEGVDLLGNPNVTVVQVNIPRTARQAMNETAGGGEEEAAEE